MRLVIFYTVMAGLVLVTGCRKNNANNDESAFYGIWTKGSNFGDTLWFMKKNGQNIMRQPMSFNHGVQVYAEKEYRVHNGQLEIKLYAPTISDYYPISSFSWVRPGKEFSLIGIDIYFFMSSTQARFNYTKR